MVYSVDTNVVINYLNKTSYDYSRARRKIETNDDLFLSYFVTKETIKVYNRIVNNCLDNFISLLRKHGNVNEKLLAAIKDYEENRLFYLKILENYNNIKEKDNTKLINSVRDWFLNRSSLFKQLLFSRKIITDASPKHISLFKELYSEYFENLLFNDANDKNIICDVFAYAHSKEKKITFYTFDKFFYHDFKKVKLPPLHSGSEHVEFVVL